MTEQELLWKYAEAQCSPAEFLAVERLLKENPSLQKELDNIRETLAILKNMEAESPSMRFTQNVLDVLPDIYPSEAAEPLVNPIWKLVFWLAVAALMFGVFLLPYPVEPSSNKLSPYMDQVINAISQKVGEVPNLVMQYFVLTMLSIGLLIAVDKLLFRKVKGLTMI